MRERSSVEILIIAQVCSCAHLCVGHVKIFWRECSHHGIATSCIVKASHSRQVTIGLSRRTMPGLLCFADARELLLSVA